MTSFIITGVVALCIEIYLSIKRDKLFKLIEKSPHKEMLVKMYLPRNIFKPFRKPEWTPIKYVFKRKHKELNNKPLSKLSDLILLLYLITWSLWAYFVLQMSVIFP